MSCLSSAILKNCSVKVQSQLWFHLLLRLLAGMAWSMQRNFNTRAMETMSGEKMIAGSRKEISFVLSSLMW